MDYSTGALTRIANDRDELQGPRDIASALLRTDDVSTRQAADAQSFGLWRRMGGRRCDAIAQTIRDIEQGRATYADEQAADHDAYVQGCTGMDLREASRAFHTERASQRW